MGVQARHSLAITYLIVYIRVLGITWGHTYDNACDSHISRPLTILQCRDRAKYEIFTGQASFHNNDAMIPAASIALALLHQTALL